MRVAVPREVTAGERRVAAVPDTVARLVAAGHDVHVESRAGVHASYDDDAYRARGAEVTADRGAMLRRADALLSVRPLPVPDVALLQAGSAIVSLLQPWAQGDVVRALATASVTSWSLDLVPRITRAQPMDALSSQAMVAGYHAVLVAAAEAPRMFPLAMTAAGTVPPARVLVLGAGVAGLQAIATARRLGAVVSAYDVRAAAAEEVRSLGASFLDLELPAQEGEGGYARVQSDDVLARQRTLVATHVAASDIVVTAAAVPGRPAPVLVTHDMVTSMRPGSVVVDLGAEGGGNCEATVAGQTVDVGGARVVGLVDAPSALPVTASALFARNAAAMLGLVVRDGALAPDWDDEIVMAACVTHAGEVRAR